METVGFSRPRVERHTFTFAIGELARKDAFWATLLFLCLFLLSYKFLGLWFMHDDAAVLYGATRTVPELLFDRDAYRSFNKLFYTPLLAISAKPDSLLFGLDPVGYHVLSLLSVFLTGLMGYATCRLYLPRRESWMAAFLFILSYPAVTNVGYLTLRHYVWGSFFSLLAFFLFKRGEEEARLPLFLASYGCYLVALLFKEAFAAFPGIILLLSQGTWRKRTLQAAPYLLVFCAYLALRLYMIGGLGGYVGIYIAPTVRGLVGNWLGLMDLVSRGTWGLGAVYVIPFFLAILALHGRVGVTLAGVFLLLTAPFWFLRPPGEGESFYLFYLPPRFLLPFFLLSLLLGLTAARAKTATARILAYAAVAVLLLLQISNAQNAYAYMKAASEEAKALTDEALRRNQQGRNILLASKDAIFYTFFYETYLRMTGEKTTGTTVSLTPGAAPLHLFKDLDLDHVDELYLEGRWLDAPDPSNTDTGLALDPSIPKAEVRISFNGETASLRVTDRREGTFYGVLKTVLSDKNILYQCLPLPRNVTLRVGLSRGMDTGSVYYCASGRCSEPVRVGAD